MSINALMDKTQPPNSAQVKAVLGPVWPHFEALHALTPSFEREWRHYGKKYGWKLRVHAEDKVLCEVTAFDAWFLVSVALREQERKDLLADAQTLALAGDVADGFLKCQVRDAVSYERTATLVRFVMARRTAE